MIVRVVLPSRKKMLGKKRSQHTSKNEKERRREKISWWLNKQHIVNENGSDEIWKWDAFNSIKLFFNAFKVNDGKMSSFIRFLHNKYCTWCKLMHGNLIWNLFDWKNLTAHMRLYFKVNSTVYLMLHIFIIQKIHIKEIKVKENQFRLKFFHFFIFAIKLECISALTSAKKRMWNEGNSLNLWSYAKKKVCGIFFNDGANFPWVIKASELGFECNGMSRKS